MTDLVVVELCGAVIKTAFKLWSHGNPLMDAASETLPDLIKSHVSGVIEQRKVRARFERMEEIVADQLLDLLKVEFRNLDEGEKNAAVLAVTETFNRAALTDKVLFTNSLDQLYLTNHVRQYTGRATRDLSMDGTALYDRILAQCCAYIIEIADKLPHFQAGAFAELLRRDDQIMARLTEVLERLPTPASDGSGAAHRVETAYRQILVKCFDRLDLFGLDFEAQWYPLSIAYVNLTTTAESMPPDSNGDTVNGPGRSRADGSSERFGQGATIFEDWLARYPRILLEGRAGGGKTTILQWIAVRAALRDFTHAADAFKGYVPFFLRLREYSDGNLPQPEQFLDKVARLLAPEKPDWPREQLKSGHALLLIDGVDEVPEPRRSAVLDWLRDMTDLFPDVRYVVTTRPNALDDGALSDAGFVQVNLEPMDPGLIRLFIDQWHAAMRESQKDTDSLARMDECRTRLINTLDNDRFLGELANTPLLAGLICALNRHLDGQLPHRRGEIFEKALAMFHERDRKRGVPVGLPLDLDATNHLLGDLALWMTRNSLIEVAAEGSAGTMAADSARGILRQSALSLPTRPTQTANLYEHLLIRGGVLREPTEGYVSFVHRTFQEYLAAKALIRTDNVGELVKHAGDDQWREVAILASGQGNEKQTNELLRGLMRAGWRDKNRYLRGILAVACLDEIRAADPGVLSEINKAIPALLPPRDMDQAERLSHAGERLIPHLAHHASLADEKTAPPIIRAAALIGGPEAFKIIQQIARQPSIAYSRREDSAVTMELIRAWRYFEPKEFTTEIINPLKLEEMRVTEEWMLREVSKVKSLRRLTLALLSKESISHALANPIYVRELTLEYCDLNSLSGVLDKWPTTTELTLFRCNNLKDIRALALLPMLRSLKIVRCEQVVDLSIIGELPTLKSLDISDVPRIDLRRLAGTPVKIHLQGVKEVLYPNSDESQIPYITDEKKVAAQKKAADALQKAADAQRRDADAQHKRVRRASF